MIVGVSGKNCAGKDTVADYLRENGFVYFSLSDAIRDELAKSGIEPTRQNLIEAGTRIRQNFGPEELASRIAKKVLPKKNYVIVSIRNPAEVLELQNLEGFFLINVVADEKTRFERMKMRKRAGDPQTLEEFCSTEKAEASSANSSAQQLDEVAKMTQIQLENNSSLDSMVEKLEIILKEHGWKNGE